jgi:hypothetical protein
MPKPKRISDAILARAIAAYRARKRIPTNKALAREAGVTERGIQSAVELSIAGKRVVSHSPQEIDRMADALLGLDTDSNAKA